MFASFSLHLLQLTVVRTEAYRITEVRESRVVVHVKVMMKLRVLCKLYSTCQPL